MNYLIDLYKLIIIYLTILNLITNLYFSNENLKFVQVILFLVIKIDAFYFTITNWIFGYSLTDKFQLIFTLLPKRLIHQMSGELVLTLELLNSVHLVC